MYPSATLCVDNSWKKAAFEHFIYRMAASNPPKAPALGVEKQGMSKARSNEAWYCSIIRESPGYGAPWCSQAQQGHLLTKGGQQRGNGLLGGDIDCPFPMQLGASGARCLTS